ncbi:MAG: hypothetical protein LBD22_00175 [Spirochaetaceae bacterium]|nr:hypothetical protein [Spirochaetaceae bacterium]
MKTNRSFITQILTTALTDFLAIVICLTGAGAAFYFFWTDLNKSLTKLNESPIASVFFKRNTAQRRFGDRVVWDVLQKDSPVYSGDVIHTSDLSETTINYFDSDGNVTNGFDLSENSLIQVYSGHIELANGKIDIRTASRGTTLKLISAGTVIEINENSIISANSAEAGGGNIQILEGAARITTIEGTQEVTAGEALSISTDGRRELMAQVVLLTPKPTQTILVIGGNAIEQAVRFTWRTSNFEPTDSVRFEVATDQRFENIVQTEDVQNSTEETLNLAAGSYWWRAYPVGSNIRRDNSTNRLSNKFSVVAVTAPKPLQPSEGSTIRYSSEPPPIRLQWSESTVGTVAVEQNFIVEIADNAAMTNPRLQQEIRGQNFFVTNDLSAGSWYWRVRPLYPDSLGAINLAQVTSRPALFTIEQGTDTLEPPQLISPADGASLALSNGIILSWRTESAATAYTVQVATGNDFASPQLNQRSATNYFNLTQNSGTFQDGLYYWRVASTNSQGTSSAYSQVRTFTISTEQIPIELVSPRDGWTTSESALSVANFNWRINPGTASGTTRWQVASNENFLPLRTDQIISGTEASPPPLEAGTYFWRVLWTSTATASVNFATQPRRFIVTATARIILDSPANNIEIDGLTALREPPSLRWSSTEPILRSRLYLSTNSDPTAPGITPILDINNPARNVQLPPLGTGTYYWTVHGETQGGINISASRPQSFRIGVPPRLAAVRLQEPRNNWTLTPAILRENRTIRFVWSTSPGANGYVFSIYRAADRARANPVFRSQNLRQPNLNLTDLTVLDNGSFIWSVEPVFMSQNDNIEQHGEVRDATFSVEIGIPSSTNFPNEETYGF